MMRFFIEDDIYKAYRLSNICDFVYLLDQPYNKKIIDHTGAETNIPKNIIRVESWFHLGRDLKQRV